MRTPLAVATLAFVFPCLAQGYDVVAVKGGGSVEGRLRFEGKKPEPQQIQVLKDAQPCGGGVRTVGEVAVDKSGGLGGAVVFLESVKAGKAWNPPAGGYVLDQTGCVFRPNSLVMKKGDSLHVKNGDPVFHNVHLHEMLPDGKRRTVFNAGMVPRVELDRPLDVEKPTAVKVECDVHNYMHDWIVVLDHPYYAPTKTDGAYAIDQIPPGAYQLVAWHPVLGRVTTAVTVKAGSKASADLVFKK